MANEIALDFGTLDLDSTNNITINSISTTENKTTKESQIPKMDGSVAEEGKRGSLIITIAGDIAGSNYDDLRTNIDTLRAGLHNGIQSLTIDDDRYIKAQLQNFKFQVESMRVLAKWTAKFIAHYPFWLAASATTDTRTPTTGVGYVINNSGNAIARVKITFTGPGSDRANDLQIENTTKGQLCKFRGTIAATKILEIDNRYDTDDFEVLNDGVDAHSSFEGDFITLDPGDNTIEITSATMPEVTITFRATYY